MRHSCAALVPVLLSACGTIAVPALPDVGAGGPDPGGLDALDEMPEGQGPADPAADGPVDQASDPDADPGPLDGSLEEAGADAAVDVFVCTRHSECDDGNPCTVDTCEAGSGQCRHDPVDEGPCNDGSECTSGDTCFAGACVGTAVICDDGDPCTKDLCDPATGCTAVPAGEAPCDDHDPCTLNDRCKAGVCKGGAFVLCNDGNPCTKDTCGPAGTCEHTPDDGAACSDLNPCTEGERCKGGTCVGGVLVSCDDLDSCTVDGCDPKKGCVHDVVPQCRTCHTDEDCGEPPPCIAMACDPGSGLCLTAPADGAPCEDGDPCTIDDRCMGGTRLAGGPLPCDDGNPCTEDLCSPATAACEHIPQEGACDDGAACTTWDRCEGGSCRGDPIPCNDQNPCTDDACDPDLGLCTSWPNNATCDDGSACTQWDACSGGWCAGTLLTCDDGNACTRDRCDEVQGCLHEPIAACKSCKASSECNDGDPCTAEDCVAGQCVFPPVLDGEPCEDGNLCTAGDWCEGGKCRPGHAADCDDGNPCTDDSCVAATGCRHVNNTFPCNDGDACTWPDRCSSGQCMPGPVSCDDGNACTTDVCSDTGVCEAVVPSGGVASAGDAAAGVRVCCHYPLVCNDANPCTDDSCDPVKGCKFVPNQTLCMPGLCEGLLWYRPTYCVAGQCPHQEVVDCDDGDPCTSDVCGPTAGCRNKPQPCWPPP